MGGDHKFPPMLPRIIALTAGACLLALEPRAEDAKPSSAPATDRVGFPEGYAEKFTVLRSFNKEKENQIVTIFGNAQAAKVRSSAEAPYANGAVIVMETAAAKLDAGGKPVLDDKGRFQRDKVAGMHVMKKEKGFGEAYKENRSGEWEFVEYRGDKSYITPPEKSASCAACHIKAGEKRDFVYHAGLAD